MADINTLIKEREERYGSFAGTSKTIQFIKREMEAAPNWRLLSNEQREALEMIAVKIGRILNGDPAHADNWVDIQGYAALAVNASREVKKADLSDIKVAGGTHV